VQRAEQRLPKRIHVGGALTHVGVVERFERHPHLSSGGSNRIFQRRTCFTHLPGHLVGEKWVFEQNRLGLENRSLIRAAFGAQPFAQTVQVGNRLGLGGLKARNRRFGRFIGDGARCSAGLIAHCAT
jgi:hypothetical protein